MIHSKENLQKMIANSVATRKGKHLTEEHRQKLREANSGIKSARYTTGIRAYQRYLQTVINCMWCGIGDKRLLNHHINHNRLDNRIGNIVRLCSSCHTSHHIKELVDNNKWGFQKRH